MVDENVFDYEQIEDVLVLTPQGDLFQYRYEALRNAYNETYRRLDDVAIRHLLIAFQSVGHFGSPFIGMLIKLAQKIRRADGEAALCGLTPDMQDVLKGLMLLENVKTDFFWVPFEGRAEALAFIRERASA